MLVYQRVHTMIAKQGGTSGEWNQGVYPQAAQHGDKWLIHH